MTSACRTAGVIVLLLSAGPAAAQQILDPSLSSANWNLSTAVWSPNNNPSPFTSTWINGNDAAFQNSSNQTLTVTEAVNVSGLRFGGAAGTSVTIDGTSTITGTGIFIYPEVGGLDVTISAPIAGTGGLTFFRPNSGSGTATVTLSGANTYTNGTAFSNLFSGTMTVKAGVDTTGSTGAFGAATNFLQLNSPSITLDLNGFNVGVGGLTGSGPVTNSGTAATFTVGNGNATSTYSGTLSGNLALTKAGTGTLTLSGANTYTGGTSIVGGTLLLDSAGALGTTGTIAFNGGTLRFSANNTTDYSARFSNAAGQQYRLDTGGTGNSVTLASNLTSDGGSLNKINAGTLTLSGSNSFTGGVTISAGRLVLNNANALGSSGDITFAGGTMVFSANNTADYSSRFTSTGTQTYQLDTGGQTVTLASNLTGAGVGLIKAGTGTLILSGTNSYAQNTQIFNGTLRLNASGSLSSASNLILGITGIGGTLQLANGTTNGSITGGTLNLTANSVIDFGNPSATTILAFGDSSAVSWTTGQSLTINGWNGSQAGGGTSRLFVGSNDLGLTSAQLAQITFTGFAAGALILSTGEIVPVSEPGTILGLATAGLGLARHVRRRATAR